MLNLRCGTASTCPVSTSGIQVRAMREALGIEQLGKELDRLFGKLPNKGPAPAVDAGPPSWIGLS